MLCIEGRVALASFTSFAVLALYQVRILYSDYWSYKYCLIVLVTAALCTIVLPYNAILKRAAFLGTLFGGSLALLLLVIYPWKLLCFYFLALSVFHSSEFLMTAIYNEDSLSIDSFLLNHSLEYQIAALIAVVEFCLEAWLCPSIKNIFLLSLIGIIFVIFGELLRKVSMMTAKSNFTHLVKDQKRDDHVLVTTGVYSWSRHPSYVGWFYWSAGTQIVLCNPVCILIYLYASWKFFYERVRDEEWYLFHFFGDEYLDYMSAVPTRIPFVNGLEEQMKPFMKKNPQTS